MKLTADQVLEKLVNCDKILSREGQIKFYLGDVNIVVKQRDVVGNIMQEWLEGWLRHNSIEFASNPNTQMPPDVFLDPNDKTKNLLEVKAFNYRSTPGFDIADFRMYEQEIVSKPYMLDVTYLIFGYDMSTEGIVTIKRIWKQKVWEITRPMIDKKKIEWPINLQQKSGRVHKIRPALWYRQSKKFNTFTCVEDFLSAIEQTVYQNMETRTDGHGWKQRMETNYAKFFGKNIIIPRWDDIKDKYILL